jgi:putative DNA primase/helicase
MNFATFASLHGLIVGDVYASDKIKRCPTEMHPRSDNGAYFFDGRRGWVFAWDGAAQTVWWNDETATPWTDAEKRAWAERRRKETERRKDMQRRAAVSAQELIKRCKPMPHNYLRSKQLPDVMGLVNEENHLIVPMRDLETNALHGAQVIRWLMEERQWEKKMLPGMKAKGAVLRLGSVKTGETWLCEGYATALSIEAALRRLNANASVLVCFSANNLMQVAPMVKGRRFVYADHDKSGTGQRAAEDTGLPFCMSDVEGNDANDDHSQFGLMAVCKKIMEARRA